MSTWTINNVAPADLDVENIVISVQNQDEDYAEIRLPRNFDAVLPDAFAIGANVVLRYGSTIVFQGEVDNPSRHATGSMEYQSVFAFGPWHRFASMPFLYLYPYVTGTELSTHGIIGGSANSLLTTILTTNAAGIVQVGTISVGTLTIPETEVYDQTLAETIQSILRYVPGAQVCFDYATTPPTIHILADNSSSLLSRTINAVGGKCSGLNLAPIYNRLVDGVTLQYEASGATTSGTLALYQAGAGTDVNTITSPTASTGFFILGTDSAGDAQSRRHFRRTIRLEGAYDVSRYTLQGQLWPRIPQRSVRGGPYTFEDLLNIQPESGSTRNNKLLMVDRAAFMRLILFNSGNFNFDLSVSTNASAANAGEMTTGSVFISDGPPAGDWLRYCRPLMRIGPGLDSMVDPITIHSEPAVIRQEQLPAGLFQSGSTAGLRALAVYARWTFVTPAGLSGYAEQGSGDANRAIFLDTRTLGAIDSSTGRFTYVKVVNNTSTTIPAAGIAAQILAANSRLLYDGGVTLLADDDPTQFFGRYRKATINPLGVATTIQRFTLDVSTGLIDLVFGTPTHLGPQDLITLLRAGTA
jgi:hypothetical protein